MKKQKRNINQPEDRMWFHILSNTWSNSNSTEDELFTTDIEN